MFVCVRACACVCVCMCIINIICARAQQLDCKRRITEWKTAEEMVELILNKVTQTEPPSPDKNNSLAIVDTAALREQRGNVITYDDLAPVTDTVRKEDKKIRLTILQKLLELACAMVIDETNLCVYSTVPATQAQPFLPLR